jgi:tetratricopeptide (TPR) repeat protein
MKQLQLSHPHNFDGTVGLAQWRCALAIWALLVLLCSVVLVGGQAAGPKAPGIHDHLLKAQAALGANDPASAAIEFRAVLGLDPKNVEAHINLGLIDMLYGDCRSAAQDFKQALAAQPSQIKAKALLGICGRRLGDPAAPGLLETSFTKLTDTKLRTQVGMELVSLHYGRGDPEAAVPVVQKLVEINPDDANVLYVAQRLYRELADDTLNKLTVVAPGSARMQQVIAERLVNAGDLDDAIIHYKKALEIDPRLVGIHFELAEAILDSAPSNSQFQADAEKELEAALKADGDSARIESLLARIALTHDDLEQASHRYTRALAMEPDNVQAQVGMGKILMTREKPEEAAIYFQKAIAADPLNSEAHYRLARAYRTLQRTEDSDKEMKLFQEIKQTKDQVRELYRQMKQRTQPDDEAPDADK